MIRKLPYWQRLGEWVLKSRWWLVALISGSILIFELVEYELERFGFDANTRFIFEIIFFVIFLPVTIGLALSGVSASRSELSRSIYFQNLMQNLDRELFYARSYDELGQLFTEFVRVVVPLSNAALYKYEQQTGKYKLIANWSLNNSSRFSDTEIQCTAEHCQLLRTITRIDVPGVERCEDSHLISSAGASTYYCMPFLFSNSPVGAARLHFASTDAPSPAQDRLLRDIASKVASVFQRIDLEQQVKEQIDSLSIEQQRLARDLHDSLGHSLAYMHLRLSQINMEFDQTATSALQTEVRALRDLAKEAYNQMRSILIALAPENNGNLKQVLLQYLDIVQALSNSQIQIQDRGQPRIIPPSVQRHVFFIFQEALTNIEKHASAREVYVELDWQEAGLKIDIADNGIGFDTALASENGHFGLKNMRTRAQEINAQFSLSSEPSHGTHIALYIPYEDES